MNERAFEFGALSIGDIFKSNDLYQKESLDSAILLRFASGEVPARQIIHRFYPDTAVDSIRKVPKSDRTH